MWFTCKECGCCDYGESVVFGTNEICGFCAEKLGLWELIDFLVENPMVDYCEPHENPNLYMEQQRVEIAYHDVLYHQLKCEKLK